MKSIVLYPGSFIPNICQAVSAGKFKTDVQQAMMGNQGKMMDKKLNMMGK
jgi:hypothetical protein